MAKPGINEFHDLNKFPKEPGIVCYGLSIPLLNNRQSPKECYDLDMYLIEKIQVSNVGAQIIYSDNLYLYSDEPAAGLKLKHQRLIEDHKRGWLNLIRKNIMLIPGAFTFMSWAQLLLDCPNFSQHLIRLWQIYEKDTAFKRYVAEDIEAIGRPVTDNTIGYILEEVLADHLVAKGQVRLQNDYVRDKEQWILNCYHGKPHRAHVYLHQRNFFGLHNAKNIFENSWYDASNRKLYDFDRLDIGTFDFSK